MDLVAGLNRAQREAVVHSDGPLVVLAGPGTGKTRVITHRIARLIVEDGARPESILALTFTVKAAEQMRERLRKLLGGEHASKAELVTVSTFHSLGQRMVRRFGDVLNVSPGAKFLDSAQRKAILRELVITQGLYPDGAAHGVEAAVTRASKLIDECGNQAVTAEAAQQHARAWALRLKKGDHRLDATLLAGEVATCERFEAMAKIYGLFTAACRERGLIGFNDLITLPIELLRTSPQAAAILRAEYRHAVVDEYQDVNAAQIELLRLLFPADKGVRGGGPDLCVVGDDDQAIYGFRGSDDRAFVKFGKAWPSHTVVRLTENYRSEQAVLDIANAVITQADERYAPDKVVERPAEKKKAKPAPGTTAHGVALEEYGQDGEVIAALLQTMRAAEPQRPWDAYAVLARSHSDLDRIAGALELEGIPHWRKRDGAGGEDDGVQDSIAFAGMLLEPGESHHVQRLLSRPPRLVPGNELLRWEQAYRAQKTHHEHGNPDVEDPGAYLTWLVKHHGDVPQVMALAEQEAQVRPLVATAGAGEVMYRIATVLGVAHAELLAGREKVRRVNAVAGLLKLAREAEERLTPPHGVREFLAYYNDLSRQEREGASPEEMLEGREGDSSGEAGGAGGVQLLTAHNAKGLEFDTVFVTRANGSHGFGKVRSDGDSEIPEELVDRAGDTRDSKQRSAAEERRLFYVAVTRAERRLVVLSTVTKKGATGSHFFEELTRGAPPAMAEVKAADVLKDAAVARRGAVELEGAAYRLMEARREVLDGERREARRLASGALETANSAEATGKSVEASSTSLREAAVRIAVVAAESHGVSAPWIERDAAASAYRAALRRKLEAVANGEAAGATADGFMRPKSPLRLSYTYLSDYLDCPRCFYVKHVLGLKEPPSTEQSIGTVAHAALAQFYEKWRTADAEGRERPGLKELVAIGEKEFFAATGRQEIDKGLLAQLRDQLRIAHEHLHDPNAQIIEKPEWEFDVPLTVGTGEHRLKVSIDRLEQVGSGYRIVDYKTGQAWAKLSKPSADDLQMGVYTLALDAKLGGGEPIGGTAEYWLLASGERGVIALDKLKRDKIRERIEKAVGGILNGEFPIGGKCRNRCEFLGP